MGDNAISELPASLGNLTRLRQLLVCHNKLRRLPEELGNCSALEELDVHHNALEVRRVGVTGGWWDDRRSSQGAPAVHVPLLCIIALSTRCATALARPGAAAGRNMLCIHATLPPQELPASLGRLQRLKLLQLDSNQISALPTPILRDCSALVGGRVRLRLWLPELGLPRIVFPALRTRLRTTCDQSACQIMLGPSPTRSYIPTSTARAVDHLAARQPHQRRHAAKHRGLRCV